MVTADELPSRFAKLAQAELDAFAHALARMDRPAKRDRAVHKGRKALQRFRALLRLAHDLAPADFKPVEKRNAALRRRFGPLRDAGARVELVAELMQHDHSVAVSAHAQDALHRLERARDAAWDGLRDGFLDRAGKRFEGERKRFERLPLEELRVEHLDDALARERKRVLVRLRRALGVSSRIVRHDLRRHLRRYATMREAVARLLRRRDAGARRLVDAAHTLGVEGDVWVTRAALLAGHPTADVRALARALDSRRKALCKLHDGELVALRRQVLKPR